MLPNNSPSSAPPSEPSLWRDLSAGTAGVGTKIVVCLALAGVLSGLSLFAAYGLAAAVPEWNRSYYYGYGDAGIYPRDELVGWVFALSSAVFLAGVVWIWSRNSTRHQAVWYAAIQTIGIAAATTAVCAFLDGAMRPAGDVEYVIGGVVCLGFTGVLLVWVRAFRRHAAPRPTHNWQDGQLALHCPACGYRMVGLHESRCPECGASYTIDELLARQDFARTLARSGVGIPPVPQHQQQPPPPMPVASSADRTDVPQQQAASPMS
jgi:hypothetical protein